ncbi:MAG: alpha/beta fold hydrolase [Verrucomicrobiota bacterium]
MNKECTFKTIDRFTIAATHTISKGKGVVLWLHGITVNRDEYKGFFKDGAEFLADGGVDSLRIDFRGHGNSSGSSLDFCVTGQMLDVDAAFKYLSWHYKERRKLVIVGCSFGAPPTLFAAEQNPDVVDGVVLIAPVLSYKRTFLQPETEWAKSLFNQRTLSRLERTNKLFINPTFAISSRLIEEMKIIKPEKALHDLNKKMVLIHGDADSMVPFQVSEDAAKADLRVQLIRFAQMEHGFMNVEDEEGMDARSLENKLRIYKIIQDQFV